MLTRLPLHDAKWTVRAVGDLSRVPAEVRARVVAGVPASLLEEVGGCVHTDLMDAGVIPDPAVGMNEAAVEWVGWTDWCYETEFPPEAGPDALGRSGSPPQNPSTPTPTPTPTPNPTPLLSHHQLDLCFDALDTLAVIELNGHEVGRANSEFIPWRFNITGLLKPGTNRLRITFTSPLRHVYELAEAHGRPHNGDESTPKWHPYNMMRKCASNFGWDWGPRVPTCGIGGGVRVEGWSTARLGGAAFTSLVLGTLVGKAELVVPEYSRRPEAMRIESTVRDGAGVKVDHNTSIVDPDRDGGVSILYATLPKWVSTGNSSTYHLEVALRIGDRQLDLRRWQVGTSFPKLNLNDVGGPGGLEISFVHDWDDYERPPVFCKGANWIPEGLWPRDRVASRIRERLRQAKAAGMNMIRVWGGGRYETEAFYDACDELGIMVWQDFMFACALYPEEEPWRTLVEQEARYQVARLSRHPCIVLWCGGNENHWAYESWGFKQRLKPGQTWGKWYWQELLPRIVAELSPHTPYVPDSPWSPPPTHPNDADTGDRHTWDVFGEDFRTVVPRFCSEFGVQSPSNMETLREAGLSEPAAPARGLAADARGGADVQAASGSQGGSGTQGVVPLAGAAGSDGIVPGALAARQRGPGGMARWYDEFFAKAGVAAPTTFEAWHAAAQRLQADWLYLAVVWLRANAPRCMGSLIWQLNDAWPGLSWSLIDSAGREKPSYHAVARAYADRLVEVVPIGGKPHRVAINDTDDPWEAEPGWVVEPRGVSKRPLEV